MMNVMPSGSRKTFRIGRFNSVNLSKRGAPCPTAGVWCRPHAKATDQFARPASTRDKDGDRGHAHIEDEQTVLIDETPGSRNSLGALSSPEATHVAVLMNSDSFAEFDANGFIAPFQEASQPPDICRWKGRLPDFLACPPLDLT